MFFAADGMIRQSARTHALTLRVMSRAAYVNNIRYPEAIGPGFGNLACAAVRVR